MKYLAVSDKERDVLEAWAKTRSIKVAAEKLNIKENTARNRIARLRWRHHLAKNFIRDVDRWISQLPGALE